MSVIVKGMQMPRNCYQCPCHHKWNPITRLDRHCKAKELDLTGYDSWFQEYDEETQKKKRMLPEWCPLIEIPAKHGRLIDADKLKEWWTDSNYFHEYTYFAFMDSIDDAETIIEREE